MAVARRAHNDDPLLADYVDRLCALGEAPKHLCRVVRKAVVRGVVGELCGSRKGDEAMGAAGFDSSARHVAVCTVLCALECCGAVHTCLPGNKNA